MYLCHMRLEVVQVSLEKKNIIYKTYMLLSHYSLSLPLI